MSDHVRVGREVIVGIWNGSEYDEFRGIIRNIVGQPAGPDEPNINCTYVNAAGTAVQGNNLANVELIAAQQNYWRATSPSTITESRPFGNVRPLRGEIVWVRAWDATEGEHFDYLAMVRAIPGSPADPQPDVHLTYYDEQLADDVNAQNVPPRSDFASDNEPQTYWVTRVMPA